MTMVTSLLKAPTTQKRVKTGCFNCRKRHKKCDETRPICGLCTKHKDSCSWPSLAPKVSNDSFRFVRIDKPTRDDDGSTNLKKYSSRLMETLGDGEVEPLTTGPPTTGSPTDLTDLKDTRSLGSTSPRLQNLINLTVDDLSSRNVLQPQLEPTPHNHASSVTSTTDGKMGRLYNGLISSTNKDMDNAHIAVDQASEVGSNHSDHHLHKRNSSASDSISPDSLMAPFLDYTNLHRTFRDYMFTNVVTSSSSTVEDLLDVNFKNILESPVPDFFNHKNSSKNLQDLLEDKEIYNVVSPTNGAQLLDEGLMMSMVEVTEDEKLQLYKTYLYEIAPWLDMFDNSKQFGTNVPRLAAESPVLLNAIYAIASRQLEQTRPSYSRQKTIKLYQDTLKYLIPTVNKTMDTPLITSCVILCVFEMMSSSPKKWRYHLEGCAALFKMHGINGFSNELERGLLWCYARMDVNSAVIGEQSTIIPSENWLPEGCTVYDLRKLFTSFGNKEDMYANYMVFLCSRVLNLIAKTQADYEKEWRFLWDEVSDWHVNRPIQLTPILTQNSSSSLFPGVLYVNGPAISANQLYHMAIILLMQNKPRMHKITYQEHIKSPIWHAKQICAISSHNEHHGCWNNALQPLWIAGQLLSSEQEHEAVLNLLSKIERLTGWQMNFRAKDLKKHWNGDSGQLV